MSTYFPACKSTDYERGSLKVEKCNILNLEFFLALTERQVYKTNLLNHPLQFSKKKEKKSDSEGRIIQQTL